MSMMMSNTNNPTAGVKTAINAAIAALSSHAAEVLAAIKNVGKGTFHTVEYSSSPKQKCLAEFALRKVSRFQVQFADYENKSAVKEYRAETGVAANNPAVQNEVEVAGFPFVFYNTNTKTLKLRVPLKNCGSLSVKYYTGDREISKEEYEQIYSSRCKLPQSAPSKTGVEFRSVMLEKITEFR